MLRTSARFLRHLRRAKSRYGIHSPFVYEFVTQVLPHRKSALGAEIDALRHACGQSSEQLEIEDFGAGYGGQAAPVIHKTLAEVVRSSARKRREGELLHRICKHYQPATLLELGVNLGFSTLYQSTAVPESKLIGLEGSPVLAQKARAHLAQFGQSPELITAEFSTGLDALFQDTNLRFDHVLLDGNHRYAPTIEYFERLLPRLTPGAMVIVDDINWSEEMRRAWGEIVERPEVSVSMDLFFLGICLINRPQEKQHFNLRFWA